MRFNTYGSPYAPPTPTIVGATQFLNGSADKGLQWDTFNGPSGESGIIIQGVTPRSSIKLSQLVCSWGGLEMAGRLEVSANPDKVLAVLFQTAPTDTLTLPLNDSLITIGTYGLRCDNNSIGGEYAVTAYYHWETA